jgi:membrane protein YqaA with SNARE-associated domain
MLAEVEILDIVRIVDGFLQNPIFLKYGLAGLFLNGLLSSVIPIPTELTTTALLAGGEAKLQVFVVLASGSIIGGFLAYYIGSTGKTIFRHFHKKPTKQDEERSHGFLLKYGWVGIFFCSWIPILGDIIPIVAGTKQYDLRKFAIAMSAGKALKILAIVYISNFFANILFQR